MKAHMIRWVRANRPELGEIATGTGTENVHMARVDQSIGYVTIGDMISVNAKIADLQP